MAAGERGMIFDYEPPGPVGAAFIQDTEHSLVGIMGPIGSGKTSCLPVKGQLIARLQAPNKADGVIRSKGYMIRDTYRNLWDKTIPSWLSVFPMSRDWPFEGPKNGPASQLIRWREQLFRGTSSWWQQYEMIVEFKALADAAAEEFSRGLYATWIGLNEADTLPGDAVGQLHSRLGRYPEPHTLAPDAKMGFGCVMCDFNAPNTSNWTYQQFFLNPKPRTKVYVQPGGREPDAENLELRRRMPDYYDRQAEQMEDWQVARFIDNKIGYSRSGQPVYPEFDRGKHVAERQLLPWRGQPILIGVDGGFDAAAVFGQKSVEGRAQVPQSVVTPEGHKTDAETFGKKIREICAGEYPHHAVVAMLDPACWQADSRFETMPTWAQMFQAASGIPCIPAPSNDLSVRLPAVRKLLNGTIGAKPILQIDPTRNDTLIEGFTAGYKIRKIRAGEDTKFAEKPDKLSHFSHVHDAMQYLALLMGMHSEALDEMIELQADRNRAMRGGGGGGIVLNDWG